MLITQRLVMLIATRCLAIQEYNMYGLDNFSADELMDILNNIHDSRITVDKKVLLPEAEVLCCKYEGQKVNLKFDLDYGFSIEPVDIMEDNTMIDIEKYLMNIINLKRGVALQT